MVVICKEDVFDWFKKLSGGKRIELMCGLLNLCIPLEWRFFATFLEQAAKRDYNSLKEAENKANSPEEFEKLTQMDWLAADIGPQPDDHHVACDVTNGPVSTIIGTGIGVACNGNLLNQSNCGTTHNNDSNSMDRHLSSVRSKIVVYLCLLNSTNRVCATLAYKAFRSQLCLENISRHLFGSVVDSTITNGYTNSPQVPPACSLSLNSISGKPGNLKENPSLHHSLPCQLPQQPGEPGYPHLILDNKFYSEIVLLHTLAIHHPAFTFDQQTLLSEQLQKVQQWMDAVMFAAAATASANSLSSCATPTGIPVATPSAAATSITDLSQSQLVNLTNKLSLKSGLTDHTPTCVQLPNDPHPKSIPPAPLIESPGIKVPSPTPLATTSCQSCPYSCTCSFSSSNSLATSPSTTPPPTSVSGQQHPINHIGSIQSTVPAQPTTLTTSPMHPYWFYFPQPISTQGPIINGYSSPAQATEQLFNYYYAVAMAAAASTFGNSAASATPYWPHFQTPSGPLTTSPFTGMPTPITTGVNSLVAAAATFQTAKSSGISCYNCGAYGHHGNECKQTNFDEQMIRN